MQIQEAVKESLKSGKWIRRKEFVAENGKTECRILPTDSSDCCIASIWESGNEKSRRRCWNPKAEDLIAEDWETADQPINSK